MSAGRFAEVERLYHEATRRRPEERAAFLDQACGGDDALRHEVESLLSLPTDAGEFLSRTALEEAARAGHRAWESASWPTIPGYTVRRVLGEGGMGVVYLAEQETPLRRLVALKLIKPGMDTRQVVARFETERQALALMDHPNIAAVFDAGSTEEGRPYFVMEFVDGVAITDYCDRERLSTCDRLDLFVRVCAAVQHAHQKGVIHRDLKPSNVLVTERDGQSLPKVIDFGTAKAVGGASIATTTQGGQGMVLGTLEYMSPEQAALSADIDTATDVYSLGVLLYELLVGRLPFDTDDLRAAGYDEIRRVIRESDPPKPSVRVEQRRDRSGPAARARQTDAPGLTRQLKGDLDWITLKALEKDRKRRYATVAAFATDIGRFLDDQPVDARPPSSTYRIRKFTRRHRGAVAAAVTLFVVLVAGLAASRWQYLRAEDARIEANRQRTEAESERARADSARASAEGATAEANIQKLDAERQRLMATQETQRAVAALDLADYRNYVIAIAAADAEVRASRFSQAREQLLAVPAARRGWEWGHLFLRTENRLLPLADRAPCPFSTDLEGRPVRRIDSLVKNPDGKQIYFTHCNRVNAWNTETLEESVAVPTSGNLIAAAMSSRRIEYSPASNNPKPQPETVRLAWPTDPTKKWNLYLVDSIGSRLPKLIGTVDREPGCAELSRDGRTLALGLRPLYSLSPPYLVETGVFESDVFEVWDVENGRRISQVRDPKPPSPDSRLSDRCFVRFSPDMTLLATSGAVVRVWVTATGVPVHVDPGLAGNNPQPIAFSPTTRQLAIGRRNGLIDVLEFVDSSWTINSLDGANILRPQPINERNRFAEVNARRHEEVVAIAFTSDGQAIVSALATAVIVWDLQSARVRRVLDTPQSSVTGLVVHEQLVYSSHADATVKVVELQALSGITKLESSTPVSEPYFRMSADGSTVAVGSTFGSLTVWNLDDRREVLAGHDNGLPIYVVAALADKRTILTRPKLPTWGTSIRWDYETRQSTSLPTLYRTEPGCGTEGPYGAAASPNDRYLAMHLGSCVVIRDLASARTLAVLPVNKPGPAVSLDMGVRFLSDESLLVSTLDGRTLQAHPTRAEEVVSIMRWNWTSKRLSAERSFPIRDRNGAMTDFLIAPSADGHRIAISSLGFATIWDGALTHPIGRVPTPPNARVALSADGERLAVCARDQNSILVWDTATAQLLLTLTDDDVPKFLAFTPSGQLIAGNSSGGLTIWETQRPKCAQCPKAPVSAK